MSTSENKHNHYLHIAIIVLIVINIIINIISMKSAESIEIMKVWWSENYEKLQVIMQSDAYKAQYAQNLELMLQQIQGSWSEQAITTTDNNENNTTSWDLNTVPANTWSNADTNTAQWDE
jgi:hypothetical protein